MSNPLLTVKQIAELLSVKPSTVYAWVSQNYIPCVRLGVGKEKPLVRFDSGEVTAWLNSKRSQGRVTRLPAKFTA